MFLLVVLGLFLVIATVFSLTKRKFPSVMKLPGPEPNFLLGNLLSFIGSTSEFGFTILRFRDTYGKIFKLHDGPLNTLVIVAEEKFLEYVLSSTKLINKADHYEYFHNWLGTGLLTSTGSKWKKRRRMLTPSFHFSILENFIHVFDSVSDIFIKKLDEHVGEPCVDINPLASLCTLDIICEASMGIPVNAQIDGDSEYVRSVKTMCRILTERNFSSLHPILYPLSINYFKEKAALRILHNHTDKVINERIEKADIIKDETDKEFGIKNRLAFLDLLIRSEIDGKPLSRLDIREEVDTFMFEGHDTVSSTLSFALYSLSRNPEAQKRAMEEQYQLFRNDKNPKITMTDLQNMKYLELVIKETLRLYPPVPVFARKVIEDFEWDGILYPKGINLVVIPYLCQRDDDYFPNPNKFIPERFIDDDGKHPYVYIPFSAGPRNCIGQRFAMLELKATISKVLRNFELLPSQPEYVLQIAPEIILTPKNGIRVSLRRRSD